MDEINYKKSLGQNFIYDKNLLQFIVKSAGVSKEDKVIEIGAGAGTLTETLAQNAKEVLSFEIDESLQERLQELENRYDNLHFVFNDFIKEDISFIEKEKCKIKVVANIPYYITTPIIFKLLDYSKNISSMMFMVQKEVAERFCAESGNKVYGISSIILQSIANVSYVKTIKKECFTPMPKVDSALVKIELLNDKYNICDRNFFVKFIHNSFAMRRKTLINNWLKCYNIKREYLEEILLNNDLKTTVRPEEISVNKFVDLANIIYKKLNNN